jgi:hypothetical protein
MAKDAPNLKPDESCNAGLVVIFPFVVTGELRPVRSTGFAFVACVLKRILSNLFPRFCLPEYSIRTDTPKRLGDEFRDESVLCLYLRHDDPPIEYSSESFTSSALPSPT